MLCAHGVLWHWLCSGYTPDTQLYATGLWLNLYKCKVLLVSSIIMLSPHR